MPKPSTKAAAGKPAKPYPDFPLFPHATRRWAKKIRGKLHYFGPWGDTEGALRRYLDQKDDLHAGRTPRVMRDGLTVRDLANRFLTSKRRLVDSGELTDVSFRDYHRAASRVVQGFGPNRLVEDLASDDFERLRAEMADGWAPVTLGNEVRRIRVMFKYAYDAGLIDRLVRYGPAFKPPPKRVLRRARQANGPRMFEAGQIRAALDGAGSKSMKAMILLGINCGFGNSDIARLPRSAIDLRNGWVDYPRPKTAVPRRCPLWPETVAAIQEALAVMPTPQNAADAQLVFVRKHGSSWINRSSHDPISEDFTRLIKELGFHRPGLGFYALRHTFETIGGESIDQVAVDHIMGHSRDDMASVYRERISDERLRAVTDHVRRWLFGEVA